MLDSVRTTQPVRVLWLLAGFTVACALAFLTLDAGGRWDFVLPFRARKIATMLLVGYAVAVSTVLFQTATENRLLTPGIMGFDSLYVLIQTCLLFFAGSDVVAAIDPKFRFAIEASALVVFSGLLHRWLFISRQHSLHLLVLTGVVLGVLFRSLATFLQRLIEPSEFTFLQDRFFASFNDPDQELLVVTALLTVAASSVGLRSLAAYDVLSLGRDTALGLGIDHRRLVSRILVVVAILIAVSTALVGPVTFFGLLVVSLAHSMAGSYRHVHILPAAILIAVSCLIGGQLVLEQVFAFETNLRVIIEFIGGVTFILLLLRGAAR